ncbi:MAG: hypothetical protein ABIH66_10670, partial [bacterium]
ATLEMLLNSENTILVLLKCPFFVTTQVSSQVFQWTRRDCILRDIKEQKYRDYLTGNIEPRLAERDRKLEAARERRKQNAMRRKEEDAA